MTEISYPWLTEHGLRIAKKRCLPGETLPDSFRRVASAAAGYLEDSRLYNGFCGRMLGYLEKGWVGLASPVHANMGTSRGLPISCFGINVEDSMDDLGKAYHEVMLLSKAGGGIGKFYGNIRSRGTPIKNNGASEGVVPWHKIDDSVILASHQGGVRRGSISCGLPIEHGDFMEWIRIRRPEGDVNRQCQNVHQHVTITDAFMERVEAGDPEAQERMLELLKTRMETGEPHIIFIDTANKNNPECYKERGLEVQQSNLCSEILLHSDEHHTFTCCLSSLNLAKYREWQGNDLFVRDCIAFLDAVTQEFIVKAAEKPGFEKAVRSARKGRPLGLGAMGLHTLLQSEMIAFGSFESHMLQSEVFGFVRKSAETATKHLAQDLGEPLWCEGNGRRNTHLMAVAPTMSNAKLLGVSPSCEPLDTNIFEESGYEGSFTKKNPALTHLLDSIGKNTPEVWRQVLGDSGSVRGLDFLPDDEKAVFRTAWEIGPRDVVAMAANRQAFIDQAQSTNIWVDVNISPADLWDVHREAWKSGVKTLYYLFSGAAFSGDSSSRTCSACEG